MSPAFELVVLDLVVQRVGREAEVLRSSATVKIMGEQMPLNHKPISDQKVLVRARSFIVGTEISLSGEWVFPA